MFQTLIHESLQSEQATCFCPQWVEPPYGRNLIVSFTVSAAERRSKFSIPPFKHHSIGTYTLAMVPSLPASHALLTPGLQDTMAL
jgi:hypothetical protein